MFFSLVYLLGILRGNIFLLLSLSLYAFLNLMSGATKMPPDIKQYALIYFIVFSIPVAGWLTALLVEKNVSSLYNKEFISKSAFIIAAALCLQSHKFVDYILHSLTVVNSRSFAEYAGIILKVSNSILKCSVTVALSLLILINLVELPFVWFCSAFGFTKNAGLSFAPLRPLIFFLIVLYTFDFISDFFVQRLWPGVY